MKIEAIYSALERERVGFQKIWEWEKEQEYPNLAEFGIVGLNCASDGSICTVYCLASEAKCLSAKYKIQNTTNSSMKLLGKFNLSSHIKYDHLHERQEEVSSKFMKRKKKKNFSSIRW